jgi:formylglycine-generating enzyme required for sulfatase activity
VAVVVGLEAYAFLPPVAGAEANAKAWYDYFRQTLGIPAYNVSLSTGAESTRERISAAASEAAAKVGPDGTLWFVFVGHGAPGADAEEGLLVAADAQPRAESIQRRSLGRQELFRILDGSQAGAIRVVLDAAFSGRLEDGGSLAADLPPLRQSSATVRVDPKMVVFAAAKGGQAAGSLPGAARPAFSYLLLGGLRGWVGKDKLTAGDLWRYSFGALQSTLHGRRQTPELLGRAKAVVGTSAGEKGPDLAALARSGAGHEAAAQAPQELQAAAPAAGGIDWVAIPGGSFMMGTDSWSDAQPVHRVTLKPFAMARAPVTFKQYRACVESGACTPAHVSDGLCYVPEGSSLVQKALPASFQGDEQPVVCVDWGQAKAYSEWVGGRLATEAQWEYAAKSAGQDWRYPWGDESPSCDKAVMDEGGNGCGRDSTWPVCSKPLGDTLQGLCDMSGNVWQWTQDWYHGSYAAAAQDGSARESPAGIYRVGRGGAWNPGFEGELRADNRNHEDPANCSASYGIRPVKALSP